MNQYHVQLVGTQWMVGIDYKMNQYHMWLLGILWMVGIDHE